MSYFREFRVNWPNLFGAALGLGFGSALNHHMTNILAPALLADFGWSKTQFALVGSLGLISLFFTPVAGRITDRLGPRRAAMIGFSGLPLALVAFSFMTGNIYQFYAISLVGQIFGILTATMVFTRVVVERFDVARGLALSFLLSCPPLVAAMAAPAIGFIVENEGWRTAYRVLAAASACGGLAAIVLVGRMKQKEASSHRAPVMDWAAFRELSRKPAFLLMLTGMFMVNLPQVLVHSQLNLMLMENGATMQFATFMVSLYSLCVVAGRLVGGIALDRIAPHLVAILALGLPTVGYVALASSFDARWVLAGAIGLVGLAQGAETDVGAYLTSRRFGIANFSFIFSMLMTSMGLASALGSLLLSFTLHSTDNYNAFLYIAAAATFLGAVAFFLTGYFGKEADHDPRQEVGS